MDKQGAPHRARAVSRGAALADQILWARGWEAVRGGWAAQETCAQTWRPTPRCCVLQLDQICISFDEGKTTMNFIEAALLIQGSACVYSKKVGLLGHWSWCFCVEGAEGCCPAGAEDRLTPSLTSFASASLLP